MIDDNKIEAAKEEIYEDRFLLNGEEIVFNNDEKEEMFYKEDIKEAIGLGAKWAINEFLKDLWHPNTEEPDKSKGDIINIGVEWLKDITSPSKVKTDGELNDNGDRRKQIGSSGYYAKIDSTGEDSVIMCAGNSSRAKAKLGS